MSASAVDVVDQIAGDGDNAVYVINLCASTTPVALVQPKSPELKRYTFFVTRKREEGRDRFRLHMGYFDSLGDAEALLPAIREIYPAAWAGVAPGARGSSRTGAMRPTPPITPSVQALAVTEPRTESAPHLPDHGELSAAATGSTVADTSEPVPRPSTAVTPSELTSPQSKEPPQTGLESMSNVREVLAGLSDSPTHNEADTVLQPAQALDLLEKGGSRADAADTAIRMLTPEDTQTLREISLDSQNKATPSFAVQLVWSVVPIDMDELPQLAIFNAYTLYHVEGQRQGRRWYGLRLGFFSDAHAAKQVAYYMRSDYAAVAVVPVTVKERDHALGRVDSSEHAVATAQPETRMPGLLQEFELLADDSPPPPKRDLEANPAPVGASAATNRAAARSPGGTKVTPSGANTDGLNVKAPSKTSAAPGTAASVAMKKPSGKRAVARSAPQRKPEPGRLQPLDSTLELLGASTLTLEEGKAQIDDSALRRPSAQPKAKAGVRFSKLLSRLSDKLGEARK